ncbi:MAG: UDP-N-acetylmuramoyl-tripeptide--D-alanyl-D-alanine ligase [Anaeromyxobacter sp.]
MTTPRFTPDELAAATGGRWSSPPAAPLEGVSTDTRALPAGCLFVALRGERYDGHAFLAEAAARGAAAALVDEAFAASLPEPVPALVVKDTLVALGRIAHLHRRRFSIPVVGVTGSNGKTTTREMVAAILATRGPVLRTEGNLNNEVGVPLTLFGLDAGHAAAVIEMGMNHAGEIGRLTAIAEPQVGLVTMAGTAHIEHLGSREAIADAKAELWNGLPAGGLAIVNADDPLLVARGKASGRRMLTFASGRGRRGDVVVLEVLSQSVEGLRFLLGIGNREVEIHIPGLVGAHNAMNAAGAAAAAVALGCSDREIQRGLAAVVPVGRRLRLERLPSGVQLVDDCYNANPDSMGAALAVLRDLAAGSPGGKAVAALGDMLELGSFEAEAHRALGEQAARAGLAALAAFGPRSRATAEAARAAGLAEVFHTEDVEALTRWVRARLAPSDVLLVKASRGMKLERLVEGLRQAP